MRQTIYLMDTAPPGTRITLIHGENQGDVVLRNLDDDSIYRVVDQKDWTWSAFDQDEFVRRIEGTWEKAQRWGITDKSQFWLEFKHNGDMPNAYRKLLNDVYELNFLEVVL